ncbi:MAG TPA: hypothetical protein VKV24_00760 [Casimicrobiaceae bacterium]|nr:hypothetical protein [Casimicrobiaceae bacterium]
MNFVSAGWEPANPNVVGLGVWPSRGLDAARVDYVLVSKNMVSRVTKAEILDMLPWSDHAPVMVEVDTAA